jgi:hypothetical protein
MTLLPAAVHLIGCQTFICGQVKEKQQFFSFRVQGAIIFAIQNVLL